MVQKLAPLAVAALLLTFVNADYLEGLEPDAGLQLLQLTAKKEAPKKNVILMLIDDFSGEMGHLGDQAASTPNLDKFAAKAASFPMAYSHHPICAPARASLLFGIYGFHSGYDWFEKWYKNPVLMGSNSMMEHFKKHGWETYGKGKIFHPGEDSDGREHAAELWTDLDPQKGDYGPFIVHGKERTSASNLPKAIIDLGPMMSFGTLESPPPGDKYVLQSNKEFDAEEDLTPDESTAAYGIQKLEERANATTPKPFFMVLGFLTSHAPLHVRAKFLAQVQNSKMPPLKADALAQSHFKDWADFSMEDAEGGNVWDAYSSVGEANLQSFFTYYLAAKAAVDDCIGQVVDAVERTGHWDNTVIAITADHGFHVGTKNWVGKWTPYEQSTRIPLLISAPGVVMAGTKPQVPVGHVDVFPTLLDLVGLNWDTKKNDNGHKLDGHSLIPLMTGSGPAAGYQGPEGVVSLVISDCDDNRYAVAVRSATNRYIYYSDGNEELYDEHGDKEERQNLLQALNEVIPALPNATTEAADASAQTATLTTELDGDNLLNAFNGKKGEKVHHLSKEVTASRDYMREILKRAFFEKIVLPSTRETDASMSCKEAARKGHNNIPLRHDSVTFKMVD